MLSKPFRALLVGAVAAFSSISASAQTILDGSDGKPRLAPISKASASRIAVEGGRIVQFLFDESELRVTEDKSNGQVFVAPKVDRPISVFVLTDHATHALVLEPKDMPVATVLVRETARPGGDGRPVAKSPVERAGALDLSVKRLVALMARGESSAEFRAVDVRRAEPLWNEAVYFLVRRFEGRQLIGEHYVLRNVSSTVMRLAEQELYRDSVLAVSIELHQLAPGAATNVFIVRLNNG